MGLEADRMADAQETKLDQRGRGGERRARDRRTPGSRVNATAPRRSLMKVLGAFAIASTGTIFAIMLLAIALIMDATPWIALAVSGSAVVISIFVLLLGSLEQRLIEIRLEIMMAAGGMRQADRRTGERRSGPGDAESPIGPA